MSRYIDADILKRATISITEGTDELYSPTFFLKIIDRCDTEDVTPIVYGKWMFREITETIEKGVKECKCSVCGFGENTFNGGLIPFFLKDCNYCPDCGAKMEGGNKNDIS